MLMPKRVKRRKQFRGTMTGKALRGNKITNGEYGIVALEPCWIKSNQIEAARIAMTRYTKRGGNDSSIIISVTEKGDKALISVKDFGIGIPRESISKIWERFYKTDVSRGKDKTGTGLGLSIVKEIITSHNEYIDVVSTEGVGTEFTFALPKAKGHAPSVWG